MDNDNLIVNGNTINLTLTSAILAVKGTCECEISLYQDDKIWSTYDFNIYVYKSPAAFDNYGQSDLNTIKDSVKKIISYSESAKMSEINAGISEINAKASEEASAANANAANLASVSAAEYASAAKNSATAADTSAANAAANASTAGAKATEAANSAASAASSASTATSKANAASTSAANAANSATEAESYAHGGTGARTNEEIDNAKYYYEQSKSISVGFSGALRPMGTVAFAQLPSLSAATEGNMYNISDQFTTNANFKEGNGLTIPAGANVYKTADGYWDILAGSPVAGVKGNAESSYRTGNVNITPADIGLGNVGNYKAVSTVASQGLTDTEKANARTNIGAGTSSFSGSYSDLTNKPTIPAAYAGSASAGGSATSAVKLDTSAGSATQPVYFQAGKPVACTYTLAKSVPSDAVFTDTNTWRGIQDNLTSASTSDSLSANQGRILKSLIDNIPLSTNTTMSEIGNLSYTTNSVTIDLDSSKYTELVIAEFRNTSWSLCTIPKTFFFYVVDIGKMIECGDGTHIVKNSNTQIRVYHNSDQYLVRVYYKM